MLKIKLWLAAALGVVLALFAAWGAGLRQARQKARTEALEGYQDTRKDIDDATDNLGSDPAVLRDWLRERGKP